MEIILPTLVALGLMAAVVVVFRRMVRAPRGLSQQDPPGVRSVAVFRGNDPELFRDDRPQEPLVGVWLFGQLSEAVTAAGIVIEQSGPIQNAQGLRCLVDGEPLGVVLEWLEGRWALSVEWVPQTKAEIRHVLFSQHFYAPRDSLALRRLLSVLNRWLKSHPKLNGLEWHRKERWLVDDTFDPAAGPIDSPQPCKTI